MILRLQNVHKTYPNGVRAIDNVSLEIGIGMFGLLGPNGAGKSSLMRTIATLQEADRGSIHFDDIDVLQDKNLIRKLLGYLPQEFGVYPNESAENLLDYFALLKGIIIKKERKKIIEEVLQMTNLFDVRKKHVSRYSGGMKRRFGIAQILLNHPKLIIVDEPTAGLDPAERHRFLNVLREIGTQNIVIFSTHLVEDVRELCSDMAIMGNGRILQKTSPANALHEIEGKIWGINIPSENLMQFKSKHHVLSASFNDDNKMSLRIISDVLPTAEFHPLAPILQDVYFSTLHHHRIDRHDT